MMKTKKPVDLLIRLWENGFVVEDLMPLLFKKPHDMYSWAISIKTITPTDMYDAHGNVKHLLPEPGHTTIHYVGLLMAFDDTLIFVQSDDSMVRSSREGLLAAKFATDAGCIVEIAD